MTIPPNGDGLTRTEEVAMLRAEIEHIQTESWQLKQACGYSIPADKETINNPFKCGICDARGAEIDNLRGEPVALVEFANRLKVLALSMYEAMSQGGDHKIGITPLMAEDVYAAYGLACMRLATPPQAARPEISDDLGQIDALLSENNRESDNAAFSRMRGLWPQMKAVRAQLAAAEDKAREHLAFALTMAGRLATAEARIAELEAKCPKD